MCRCYHLSMEWCRQCPQCVSQRSKLGKRRSPLVSIHWWLNNLSQLTYLLLVKGFLDSLGQRWNLSFLGLTHCNACDLKDNLWLCLTCGSLGCGRQQFIGVSGNGHGLAHYKASGPAVSINLVTITPKSGAGAKFLHFFIFFCQWLIQIFIAMCVTMQRKTLMWPDILLHLGLTFKCWQKPRRVWQNSYVQLIPLWCARFWLGNSKSKKICNMTFPWPEIMGKPLSPYSDLV